MHRYRNLDSLLNSCETAKVYFTSLPDYVRGAAVKHSEKIRSEDDLHKFADGIIHEFN